jgi:CheY-like chemotaxis protein
MMTDRASQAVSMSADATADLGLGTQRILLIEDDDDSAALLISYAERLGHVVVRATSGEEAVEIASASRVDLAIVDLLLPGMSGWDLIGALRANAATARCPIVVCSVLERQDYPKNVQGSLPKPYTRGQVEQLLRSLLPTEPPQ